MDDKELLEAIEHAATTGAKSLDLSEQSLTALPPEIGQMIGLTEVWGAISCRSDQRYWMTPATRQIFDQVH